MIATGIQETDAIIHSIHLSWYKKNINGCAKAIYSDSFDDQVTPEWDWLFCASQINVGGNSHLDSDVSHSNKSRRLSARCDNFIMGWPIFTEKGIIESLDLCGQSPIKILT
jgi:hypothetical protein